LAPRSQLTTDPSHEIVEARRRHRFQLEVSVCVYPRGCPVLRGDTVDISESWISAMLRGEVRVGEVVRLEFALPLGDVEFQALVRQRSALRDGFQFVESGAARDINCYCSQLLLFALEPACASTIRQSVAETPERRVQNEASAATS
jgi:hypothetical protein